MRPNRLMLPLIVVTAAATAIVCTLRAEPAPAAPAAPTAAARWTVVPLQPGQSSSGNFAILLDTQTGDTWTNNPNNNAWAKMGH